MSKSKTIIRDQFIKALEAFDPSTPWIKPWIAPCSLLNAQTGRPYSGINILMLSIRAAQLGVNDGGWLTFNQAKQLGGTVKKGEKSTKVVFYKPVTKNKDTDEEETYLVMKAYSVFHTSQCEDIDMSKLKLPEKPQTTGEEREDVEALIDGLDIYLKHGSARACYAPAMDVVYMPNRDDFYCIDGYYRTLFHEYVHATGHHTRLDRNLVGKEDVKNYAFEELVAEMGSVLLGSRFGLQEMDDHHNEHVQQHAAYVAGWIKLLEDDTQALFRAWSLASAACDWILNHLEQTDSIAA